MPKTEFTPLELKQYFTDKRKYHYCDLAREKEAQMRVHADGCYPEKLIGCRRPNEPLNVQEYRKTIFVPKTKPYFNKIENTLQKIRRSSDWAIKYPDASFDKIIEGEKMQDYAESHYPVFNSVTNWAFSLLLRNYLIDANAIVVVSPLEAPADESSFVEPIAIIFNSCDVIDFVEGDYAVLENKAGCMYMTQSGPKKGKSFYIITTERTFKYDQINGRGDYGITFEYEHGLEMLPAFKLGGIVVDVYGSHSLYESRISGILPEFNEALRENSDLQAAVVLSMFPERWEYTQNQCKDCKGIGKVQQVQGDTTCQVVCNTCAGSGMVAAGPYSKVVIGAVEADKHPLPTPPMGYVQGPVEIIKLQQQGVKDHIFNALAAINFEFLADTPLTQSGVAKEVDKDELNNMVHSIAEDIVRIMDKVYCLIGLYRYSVQYTPDEIYEMLPKISVPEKYDILSAKYYDEQITSAIKNKLNPAITNVMQVAYASKAFNNDPDIAENVQLILQLDPLSGISEDDKNSRLAMNGITLLDYVTSSNINKFVAQAIETMTGFKDLDVVKQKAAIQVMAEAQIKEQAGVVIPPDGNNLDE